MSAPAVCPRCGRPMGDRCEFCDPPAQHAWGGAEISPQTTAPTRPAGRSALFWILVILGSFASVILVLVGSCVAFTSR